MEESATLNKVLHLLIDQYIQSFEKYLESKEVDKNIVYLEIIKRSPLISHSIRTIALNFTSCKFSDIPVSEDDIQIKIHNLVENSIQQDLIECALDANFSTNKCLTNDDLHNILFVYALEDSTSVAPSLMLQLTYNLFEKKLLLHSQSSFPGSDLKDVSDLSLSKEFENVHVLFEKEVSQLQSTLGTGISVADLKGSETTSKNTEKSLDVGDNTALSSIQKEPSRIEDWLQSVSLFKEQSFFTMEGKHGLSDIPSNLSSWEGKMRQMVPCHLYTTELVDKEVLLNVTEDDSGMFRILHDVSGVLSENDFVHDVLNLLVGIPSETFLYDEKRKSFKVKSFTRLGKLSSESTSRFCEKFIQCGSTFYKLKNFSSPIHPKEGLIMKGLKEGIQAILSAYMEYITSVKMNDPTIHAVRTDVSENAQVLNSLGGICGIYFDGNKASNLPKGIGLLSYLNKTSWPHKTKGNSIMIAVLLKYAYSPYFCFLNKWLSEGFCFDPYDEFQIEEDLKYLDRKDELYWKFTYTENEDDEMRIVPSEIKKFSLDILQCGKSMRLLQNCGVQLNSLDYMTCNPPPCLSMVFSYQAMNSKMEECELYILKKESFELKLQNEKDLSEEKFYLEQQVLVTQEILAEQITKRWNNRNICQSAFPCLCNAKERINLKKCKSFPNLVQINKGNNFDGIIFRNVGILFFSNNYYCKTSTKKNSVGWRKQNVSFNFWKFTQERNMNSCSTSKHCVLDKFQNKTSKYEINSLKQMKGSQNLPQQIDLSSFQQAECPPGSFMDCLLSLLVSEYGDSKKDIYSCIQLISLQNLMQYNFKAVLSMRLHLVQKTIMDYIVNQLRLEDLFLGLMNTYFLQDESFSECLCRKLFKWTVRCSSLGEFAEWPVLNKILTRSVAVPSLANIPFLKSASINFVPIHEEYLSKKNKFMQFFQYEFEIDWPLNTIVHKACISHYISIHSLILEMEFLCWLLGKIWRIQFIDVKNEILQNSPQFRKMMLYRFSMHQFVRIVRSSIHQDLGGPLWEFLQKSLQVKELNIDVLEDIHLKYLEKALERCFLTQDTIFMHETLDLILRQVNSFCGFALSSCWEINPNSDVFESPDFPIMSDCYEHFTKSKDHFLQLILKMLGTKKFKISLDYRLYLETILEGGKSCS
ncbi:gamma-tubulin complex component [Trichonephila inaurata madagascariensis]|uniref:Gamma-tubulin complex component n=1 Tax=Trichonephila inaurata madagascariensis TaxID=2747483 RepID=A0A8X6XKN6_9ARAC|nr:gamma-tubulin complex component [Trichonephila inaurata madagascariensis]